MDGIRSRELAIKSGLCPQGSRTAKMYDGNRVNKIFHHFFRFIYFDWLINTCLLFFSVDLLTEQLNLETVVVAISLTTSIQS